MAWCLAPMVFGALALLAGCARLPVAETSAPRDRFASAYVELLPEPTPLNINTASPEVLAAVIGLDVASAKRLESKRPFKTLQDARGDIPASIPLDPKRLGVGSNYFIIAGVLRMDGRVLEERLLVKRDNRQVLPLARTRQALLPATP